MAGTPVQSGHHARLLARLTEKPDLTMRALTAELAALGVRTAVTVVRYSVRRVDHRFGMNRESCLFVYLFQNDYLHRRQSVGP